MRFSHSRLDQPLVDTLVLFSREDVRPNRQIIVVAVNEFEWKHGDRDGVPEALRALWLLCGSSLCFFTAESAEIAEHLLPIILANLAT